MFVFPKAVIHEIQSLCMKFLWSAKLDGAKKFPVAWDLFVGLNELRD